MGSVLTGIVLVFVFVAGAWAQTQTEIWPSPDPLDAVRAAPKNHKVLFEDDHVRVIEVTVQPAETENMHTHKYPSVFIYDAAQPQIRNRMANGGGWEAGRNFSGMRYSGAANQSAPMRAAVARREVDLPVAIAMGWPAAIAVGPDTNGPHQVTNLDTFPHHFYRFEFKRLDGTAIETMAKYPQ